MMNRAAGSFSFGWLALLALLAVATGCAHMSDLQTAHARGHGTSLSYAVSFDDAWSISENILRDAGAETFNEHRDKGYLLTNTAVGDGLSVGTYVGVWFEPDGPGQTKVTVITKRKSAVELITALTEGGFHHKFSNAVAALASGHPAGSASGGLASPSSASASNPSVAATATPAATSGDLTKDQCVDANTKAQSLRRSNKLTAARAQLAICVDARCPQMVRDDCVQRLDELERAQPTVVFDAKDAAGNDVAAVRVTVDGKTFATSLDGTALPADPGSHAFRFEAQGLAPVTRTLVVKEGEKARREKVAFSH